ncbi:hypothetical protein LINPERPRIM_LOCUS1366, partial [Linum perenne]
MKDGVSKAMFMMLLPLYSVLGSQPTKFPVEFGFTMTLILCGAIVALQDGSTFVGTPLPMFFCLLGLTLVQ